MAKILQIAQLGNDVLRQRAISFENLEEEENQELIADMVATVVDVNGMGLAAPQVYEPCRLFIIASHPSPRYPNAPEMTPTPIINPEIISYSKEISKEWEACLSVPGIRGLVPRPKTISVRYTTRDGDTREGEFSDFVARIFQHEFDHLNGIMYLDRLESTKDIVTEKEFNRLIARK